MICTWETYEKLPPTVISRHFGSAGTNRDHLPPLEIRQSLGNVIHQHIGTRTNGLRRAVKRIRHICLAKKWQVVEGITDAANQAKAQTITRNRESDALGASHRYNVHGVEVLKRRNPPAKPLSHPGNKARSPFLAGKAQRVAKPSETTWTDSPRSPGSTESASSTELTTLSRLRNALGSPGMLLSPRTR